MESSISQGVFKRFFRSEMAGGFVLIFCTIVTIIVANSSIGENYIHFWHSDAPSPWFLQLPSTVEHWINDGLMSIFFLLVGLEIEREIYVGEFSNLKKALLPIFAAIGGMLIPAVIYFALNYKLPTQSGFGIPMATDIAFALGMLSLAGKRVPASLKVFLTALAIIDDIGAILIIGIFYTQGFSLLYFGLALVVFAFLLVLNRMGVSALKWYLVPGVVLWYLMLQSGIHATIAGILLAFAVPFTKNDEDNPSYKLQNWLHAPVAFVILPLFALANTAILIPGDVLRSLQSRSSLGILAGLLIGKVVGVIFFSVIALKTKLASISPEINKVHMIGAGILAGIGFTMSIFITNLAFSDPEIISSAKLSILVASTIAAVVGVLILRSLKRKYE
ncbi:Na+/H+ antiporter NhaA [Segetibacter sp. 3557_3]|uniref:Na+/H+ antiporter NhaA n=1 Tax=Segetibacter sp. 3557_3 TaxID=2547429 RepID=UPI0010587121|nr:Na+/H+ antiporter NhaA [Segetibacter sp. 3557_3]TDH26482.1 Na+/H+ antiporter NhaA [Segetibacter sp. 3557_3]